MPGKVPGPADLLACAGGNVMQGEYHSRVGQDRTPGGMAAPDEGPAAITTDAWVAQAEELVALASIFDQDFR